MKISPEELKMLIDYDPKSGSLTWKHREPEMGRFKFPNAKGWNGRNAGKECFTAKDGKGYRHGRIMGNNLLYHRVLWAIHYGRFPEKYLDHINGDKTDNRIENLREVDQKTNSRNSKMSSRNTSGVTGVRQCSKSSSWIADIGVDMKCFVIGRYKTFEEAVAARKAAEKLHGYHKNHGRSLYTDNTTNRE